MTSGLPTADYGNGTSFFEDRAFDQKRAVHAERWSVDEDYLGTLGIKLIAGRNFSRQMPTDSDAVVINEAAAKRLSYSNPLNQLLYAPVDEQLKMIAGFSNAAGRAGERDIFAAQDRPAVTVTERAQTL